MSGKEAFPTLDYIQTTIYENSLSEFIRGAWHILEPDNPYVHNWHVDAITEHLEAVSRGHIKRLLINMSPRMAKSLIVSVFWPAWTWTWKPSHQWLCGSYALNLAIRDTMKMRRVIESEWYQSKWGDKVRLLPDQNKKDEFGNTKTGHRIAVAVNSSGTGKGCNTLIVDDGNKAGDANSLVKLAATNYWFDNEMTTRLNDKRKDSMVIVMQRLSDCLLPDTKIATINGSIPIINIGEGDMVLGSSGYVRVIGTACKPFNNISLSIKVYGDVDVINVTGDHRFMCAGGWVEAKDLTDGDILEQNISWLGKLKDSVPDMIKPRYVDPPKVTSRISYASAKKYNVSKSILESAMIHTKNNTDAAKRVGMGSRYTFEQYCGLFKVSRCKERNPVVPDIVNRGTFWYFVGYWLAEGFVSQQRQSYHIVLTTGRHSKNDMLRIQEFFISFNIPCSVKDVLDNVTRLDIHSYQIGKYLIDLFGSGAKHKFIDSSILSLPVSFIHELIRGYVAGDGSLTDKVVSSYWRVSSVSLRLLQGIRLLLLKLNIPSQLTKANIRTDTKYFDRIDRYGNIYPYKIKSCGYIYTLRFYCYDAGFLGVSGNKPKNRHIYINNMTLYSKIRSITRKVYSGEVYDIQTESGDFVCGVSTLHNCDLAGHVLEKGSWDHLILPMEYDELGVQSKTSLDYFDPRIDDGELLFPERFPDSVIKELKNDLGSIGYASQYQQSPVPTGGNIVKREYFKFYTAIPEFDYIVHSWDFTFKGSKSSDYVAGGAIGIKGANKYILPKVIHEKLNFIAALNSIKSFTAFADSHYGNHRDVIIEAKANGEAIIDSVRNEISGVIPFNPKDSKEARASAVAPQIEAGNVYLPDTLVFDDAKSWVDDFITEWIRFPYSKHDDFVDFLSQALIRISNAPKWLGITDEDVRMALDEHDQDSVINRIFNI